MVISNIDKKIAFFYPSRNIGGAQLLFARLAVFYLQQGIPVLIIDYEDGFILNYIFEQNYHPQFIIFNDLPIQIEDEVCLIQHLSAIHTFSKILHLPPTSTLIFWSIHPHNILSLFRWTPIYTRVSYKFSKYFTSFFEPFRKRKIQSLLSDLFSKNALYYMDKSNYETSKEIGLLNKKCDYIPIPIIEKNYQKDRKNFEVTNFAWIGRITDSKINSFNYIVSGLSEIAKVRNITFNVIGQGDKSIVNSIKNIKVIDHGIIQNDDLTHLLVSNIDCVFAMGTSVLESAILKIPSVLVDLSKTKFPQYYKFRWIFETSGFSLGSEAKRSKGTIGFNDICKVVFDPEEYDRISEECYLYTKNNHNIGSTAEKLLRAVKESRFTVDSYKKYYP